MVRDRIIETEQGIQGEIDVAIYNQMQRRLRDKGWIETQAILDCGISSGNVLELGPGPGYLGLEWLQKTTGTKLTGVDIIPDMISLARHNATEYGLSNRAEYIQSNGATMPFGDGIFDAAFSNSSLHEWNDVKMTLDELCRVLKPGGLLFIADLRRDMHFCARFFLWLVTRPKEIRPGLITSINASYTTQELQLLTGASPFVNSHVTKNFLGLQLVASKSLLRQ